MTQSIPLFTTQVKSRDDIRDDILRTLSNFLKKLGIPNPNVGPKSDYYGIATGLANEICVGLANGVINTDNQMPDTAGGAFLDRWLALFGLKRAGATSAFGVVLPTYALAQGYTNIPLGSTLQDAAGLVYQVIAGGSYGPGNPGLGQPANLYVPVEAVDAGAATDHANGDTLTWVSIIPYTGPTVTVGTSGGTDGLTGGNDSEATQDEPPRQRLLARLQNPPTGGNWPDVVDMITKSSVEVQMGFVFPALLGPSTVFFTACRAAQTQGILSSTSKNRSLPVALMNGTVIPYVQGQYSTRAAVIGASVVDYPVDIGLILSLPAAPTSQPSGPGGGWLDGTPWPTSNAGGPCLFGATDSTHLIGIGCVPPPVAGVSRVAYISQTNWQLYTATVIAVGGTAGSWTATIDTPWPNVVADAAALPFGAALFPQSSQQQNYLTAVLSGFANLGCGEWSSSAPVLVRSFRHPSVSQTWFGALDANFLRTVENAGQEVLSAQWLYTTLGGSPPYAPPVPATPTITTSDPLLLTSAAPNIIVPRSISWYQQ